jgi:hypothetical protein
VYLVVEVLRTYDRSRLWGLDREAVGLHRHASSSFVRCAVLALDLEHDY